MHDERVDEFDVTRLAGFAVDGVAKVAVVDAAANLHETRVVDDVFARESPPHRAAGRRVAKVRRGPANREEPKVGKLARDRIRRIATTVVVAVLLAGLLPGTAYAYWNFQGYRDFGEEYGRWHGGFYGWEEYRLSRDNCHAKWQQHIRGGGWEQIYWGCSISDTGTNYYDASYYDASRAINNDCCTVWVNVRIVET